MASIAAGGEHSIMAISWGRVVSINTPALAASIGRQVVSFGSNAVGQLGIGRNNQGRDVIRCSPSIVASLSDKVVGQTLWVSHLCIKPWDRMGEA